MDSASLQFIFFGFAAALISNLSRSRVWRSAVLAAATAAFLVLLHPGLKSFLPMLAFLLLGYAVILSVGRFWKEGVGWGCAVVVLIYIWLKKYTFLPQASFLHFTYFTLGISYIFFRVLHLIIESGREENCEKLGFGAYLLYTLNFTTFVSGPIQRYQDFARDQFAVEPVPLDVQTAGLQIERIVRGFFKVSVLAMILNNLRHLALNQLNPSLPLSTRTLLGLQIAIAYPFFLYCNFSGYIDIVIGIARLMRLRLPENFDRPFSSTSFIEFWNRWHITLSAWLKNYVYNPLLWNLMLRGWPEPVEPFLGVLSFFVTFFLVGLWHGRTSEFLFFGVLQGSGVAINKLWQLMMENYLGSERFAELSKNHLYLALSRGLTFSWFAFTLFWFWGSWKLLHFIYSALNPGEWAVLWLALWLLATIALGFWEWFRTLLLSIHTARGPVLTSAYARVVYASAMGFLALVVTVLLNQAAPDIVYKAF